MEPNFSIDDVQISLRASNVGSNHPFLPFEHDSQSSCTILPCSDNDLQFVGENISRTTTWSKMLSGPQRKMAMDMKVEEA